MSETFLENFRKKISEKNWEKVRSHLQLLVGFWGLKPTITTLFDWKTGIVKILKIGFLSQLGQKRIIPSLQLTHFFL